MAPILAAPLLTDTRRSTVGPGMREDMHCFAVLALVVEFIVPVPAVSVLPVHEVEYIARHAVGVSAWFLWPTAAAGSVQLL